MNKEEAEKIIAIMCTADGGCSACVEELIEKWNIQFPEFEAYETEKYAIWKLKEETK